MSISLDDPLRNVTREELRSNPHEVMEKARRIGTLYILNSKGERRATLSLGSDSDYEEDS